MNKYIHWNQFLSKQLFSEVYYRGTDGNSAIRTLHSNSLFCCGTSLLLALFSSCCCCSQEQRGGGHSTAPLERTPRSLPLRAIKKRSIEWESVASRLLLIGDATFGARGRIDEFYIVTQGREFATAAASRVVGLLRTAEREPSAADQIEHQQLSPFYRTSLCGVNEHRGVVLDRPLATHDVCLPTFSASSTAALSSGHDE